MAFCISTIRIFPRQSKYISSQRSFWSFDLILNLRRCIRQVLEPGTRTVLPEETITRAQYYLSQVLHSKPNSDLLKASQLRTNAQVAMKRLTKSSPWTYDVETVEEPILYDFLVAAGLRISIMTAEPEKPRKASSILSRYSRFLGKGVYTLGT